MKRNTDINDEIMEALKFGENNDLIVEIRNSLFDLNERTKRIESLLMKKTMSDMAAYIVRQSEYD